MERQTNETAIVNAQDGFGNTFTVFKRQASPNIVKLAGMDINSNDNKFEYICISTEPESEHHTTICIYDNYKEFVESTTFHTWILQGIKDKELSIKLKLQ